ncbi:MAG: hypothetical protein A2498_14890 [Lentisphaerae bacterium RIFOXYC12_FULL_60_16]|nr:MAG: hypothetical protein A2498_14890 [Lentisphaerae bacterium RIFOXYC12_FULL_60_16]OGV80373.1 MAG: hypothetical protein A2340_15225 [Lentisphaerae bacterium RIFOXYB12_FULL_60_10]
MTFMRFRAEQLADYLRESIQRGELRDPLPATRGWSKELGVGRTTLDEALSNLRREGLVTIVPGRGVRLNPAARAVARRSAGHPRLIRMLYSAHDYPYTLSHLNWVAMLEERLYLHGAHVKLERYSDARWPAILRRSGPGEELFVLCSLSPKRQRLFERSRKPCLIVGQPAPEVSLPFVRCDHEGMMRHATHRLLRRGFARVSFVAARCAAPAIPFMTDVFRSACAEWPRQPVDAQVVLMPLELSAMATAARHFAASITGRHGILVMAPIPVGMIQTAITRYASGAAGQVEFIGLLTTEPDIGVCPLPAHYPAPIERIAGIVANAAIRYFDTGALPTLRKIVGLKLIPESCPD